MFSTPINDGGPAMATRSRRRQRPASSDSSIQQPKAKRQRVPLTEQTFLNPDAGPEMYEVKADRVAMLSVQPDGIENAAAPAPRKELSVRSKKPKAGERISKGDGSVLLVGYARTPLISSTYLSKCMLTLSCLADEHHRLCRQQAPCATG
jgi:nuclear pore complex protein Nup133